MNIKQYIKRHNTTQTALAKFVGVDKSQVTRWVKGASKLDHEQVSAVIEFFKTFEPTVTFADIFEVKAA